MTLTTLRTIITDGFHFIMSMSLTPKTARDDDNVGAAVQLFINPLSAQNRAAPTDCWNHSIMGIDVYDVLFYI